jgi:hypothetical protein
MASRNLLRLAPPRFREPGLPPDIHLPPRWRKAMKKPGVVFLAVLGLLFLIQSVFIAVRLSSSEEFNSLVGSLFGCVGCWLGALYSYSTAHRRSLTVALIIFAIAFFGTGVTFSAIQFFHNRHLESEAQHWVALAQKDARPTWTEDDAIHWLKEHDILPYQGEYHVDGYQQIDGRGIAKRPTSVQLSFLFDLNHKFQRVEYHVFPFEPPSQWRR